MEKKVSASGENLLLSSMAEYWSLIEPLLLAAKPASLCEIGIGGGALTRRLLDFSRGHSCKYAGIDAALDEHRYHDALQPNARFIKAPSLSTLSTLEPIDVYFVDGDHNYYTVLNELKQIARTRDAAPLIFVHDTGWPWGRRDHYCSPETIPAEFRHGYSTTLGVIPGRNELGKGGFSGDASDYAYGAADHEGGPRNGVLTAVEDFLGLPGHGDWRFFSVPGVFGFGILYSASTCPAELRKQIDGLEQAIAPLAAFLAALEKNRIDLFIIHLENLAKWKKFAGDYEQLQTAYGALEKHSASLLQDYQTLIGKYGELDFYYNDLAAHHKGLIKDHEALQQSFNELKSGINPPSPMPVDSNSPDITPDRPGTIDQDHR